MMSPPWAAIRLSALSGQQTEVVRNFTRDPPVFRLPGQIAIQSCELFETVCEQSTVGDVDDGHEELHIQLGRFRMSAHRSLTEAERRRRSNRGIDVNDMRCATRLRTALRLPPRRPAWCPRARYRPSSRRHGYWPLIRRPDSAPASTSRPPQQC